MNKLKYKALFFLFVVCFSFYSSSALAQEDTFDLRESASAIPNAPSIDESKSTITPARPSQVPQENKFFPPSFGAAESTGERNNVSNDTELITVNFENVDIRDVIRILADKAQLNMVVGPEVSAVVNLQLSNVTWNKALDVILKTYNLTYKREGELVRIMTLDQLQQENDKVPLETKIIILNFARANEIKGNFQ